MTDINDEFLCAGTYAIVSAFRDEEGDDANDCATARLRAMLELRGVAPVEVWQGKAQMGYLIAHPNWRSDTIWDIAIWAGRVFAQDAILFAHQGRAYLMRCGDVEVEAEYSTCAADAHSGNRTEVRTSDGKTLAFTWC